MDPRIRVLKRIMEELDASGANYALIHGNSDASPSVTSDVDIACGSPPPQLLEPILQRLHELGELTIINRLHYEVPHGYYYIIAVPNENHLFLHLDCLYDPIGINRYHLPTTFLLDGAIEGSFCRHTHPKREAIYLLMKRAIKGKISADALDALRARLSHTPDELWSDIDTWFGKSSRYLVEQLLSCTDAPQATPLLQQLASMADRRSWRQHPARQGFRWVADTVRKFTRFFRPTGLFVVVVGPDGSGKSTITTAVLVALERAFRRTWRFHWRPGLLPKLGRNKVQSDSPPPSAAPPEFSKHSGGVSLVRFLYYWLDFVLGYWLIIYPRKAQSTLVMGERYFPDVLVHPERYGFSVPRWVMRLAAKCVPSPDLLILLKDDPEIIFARKSELQPAMIARQITAYEDEGQYWNRFTVIHTEGGVTAVTHRASQVLLELCNARTMRELAIPPKDLLWRAFPSALNVKVWVNEADKLRNALNLYHPYSSVGLLAKSFAGMLPRWAYRLLLRNLADASTTHRLVDLTQRVRRIIHDDSLVISFYAGTPGPHQKTTAQVARDDQIIGYIKIGHNEHVGHLLQHEAGMLRWLEQTNFVAAVVPRVVTFKESGNDTFLLLSPPPKEPGVPRNDPIDTDDIRFLEGLGALGRGTLPVHNIIDQIKVDKYLHGFTSHESAQLLLQARQAVEHEFGSTGVRVCACHGDFAPWNTLEIHDGRMFVFDWEYARQQGPVLGDLFHRVISPLRLIERLPAADVVDRVFKITSQPRTVQLLEAADVPKQSLSGYLLLYLLDQICMRPNPLHYPEPFLMNAIRETLARRDIVLPRPRILVAAYACEPGSGSEPGVGWRMCQAISREHDVWVITRINNRTGIESALAVTPNSHLHFSYTDLPHWAMRWKKGERGVRLYYYLWQFAAWRVARNLMKAVTYDAGHHVTFVNDYTFSFLGLLPIPFVWGPIGSNRKGPASLMSSKRSLLRDRAQYWLKATLRTADPLIWLCAARARLVVGNHSGVLNRLPFSVLARNKYRTHLAIGVEEQVLAQPINRRHEEFRVISVGNLLPIKQFHLTLRAFARLIDVVPHARLTIVGKGPLKDALKTLSTQLNIESRVDFQPFLPRPEALALMARADVFLFPSFEVAGMVVLEALAHELPVIALKDTGPGEMITSECGYAVEIGSLAETTKRLADAMISLAVDPERRKQMGEAGRQLVRTRYLWEQRHESVRAWYLDAEVVRPEHYSLGVGPHR